MTYLVYPGAMHSRYNHALGAMYLMQKAIQILRSKGQEITEEEALGAYVAILLHDVGHGPFSHLFEDVIATRCAATTTTPSGGGGGGAPPAVFCHEVMSQSLMLRVAKRLELDTEMIRDVSALMAGGGGGSKTTTAGETPPAPTQAPFYKELISNKRNGIDVDRLDYLIRDSLCCFGKPTMDVRVNRLFNSARIISVNNGEDYKMAFEQKMAVTIRDLFALRAKLHKSVYQHHVVKAVGHMIGDILFHAAGNESSSSTSPSTQFLRVGGHTLQECATDPELFIKLGDWILDAIDASGPTPITPTTSGGGGGDVPLGLGEARRLLYKLRSRELYSLSGCINIDPTVLKASSLPQPTAGQIEQQLLESLKSSPHHQIQYDANTIDAIRRSIIVEVVSINHGKGDKDPLQFVDFYNPKDIANIDRCFSLKGSSPLLSPSVFEEKTIMVFSRDRAHNSAISTAFERWVGDGGLNGGVTAALYPGLAFHNPRTDTLL